MPRSGTTLVETIVGSHSRISIPPGDFPFAEQYARGLSVEKIFEILSTKETWDLWQVKDFESLIHKNHDYAFRQSLLDYARGMNKDIPGSKAPLNEFFYDTYATWLSDFDLKFFHVIRNPLDVMASLKHSRVHKNLKAYHVVIERQSRNWLRSTALGLARQVRRFSAWTPKKKEC
jgi:hypothetical protein